MGQLAVGEAAAIVGVLPRRAVGAEERRLPAVEANIAANPGAFASHAYPVADALAQLIGDAQRGATSALVHTDFASIGAASLAALHYCGAPPPTAQKPGAST